MARACQMTGKVPVVGNNVSHASNKAKRRFLPDLQNHRFWTESESRQVDLCVSNAGLRLADKGGVDEMLVGLCIRGEV